MPALPSRHGSSFATCRSPSPPCSRHLDQGCALRPPPKDATSPRRAVRRALGTWPQSSPHCSYPTSTRIISIVQVNSARLLSQEADGMRTVNIHEAKTHLSRLIEKAVNG